MGWLGNIFTGQNSTISSDIGGAGEIAGFGTSVGQGDIGAASAFDSTLLSGNGAAEAKLLAPQISNIQKQGQQQIDTAAQFGNRSGGTNASAQSNIDSQRANVSNMISQLTGGAATSIGNLGTSTLGLGLSANQVQEQEAQQQMEDEKNSVFGSGIADAAKLAEVAAFA